MVTPRFEVAFDVAPGAEPGPADWIELPRSVAPGATVSTGRRLGDGRATVELVDLDRTLDPTNPVAPYNLVPMRHARLSAVVDGTAYPLFRGYVERWDPAPWDSPSPGAAIVQVVPATVWLALLDAVVTLPRQRTDERVQALLDLAGWPDSLRDIEPGVVKVEAVEEAQGNLLALIGDVGEAEGGELFIAPDGKLTFRSRHARFDVAPSLTVGAGGVAYTSARPGQTEIINIGVYEAANGDTAFYDDAASRQAYGTRTSQVRDLALPLVEGEAIATWSVVRHAEPSLTVDDVQVDSSVPGALPSLVQLRVGDLVDFSRTSTVGATVEMLGHVEHVRHRVGRGGQFGTSFDLSPYHGAGPWFLLDDDTLGELNSPSKLAP